MEGKKVAICSFKTGDAALQCVFKSCASVLCEATHWDTSVRGRRCRRNYQSSRYSNMKSFCFKLFSCKAPVRSFQLIRKKAKIYRNASLWPTWADKTVSNTRDSFYVVTFSTCIHLHGVSIRPDHASMLSTQLFITLLFSTSSNKIWLFKKSRKLCKGEVLKKGFRKYYSVYKGHQKQWN